MADWDKEAKTGSTTRGGTKVQPCSETSVCVLLAWCCNWCQWRRNGVKQMAGGAEGFKQVGDQVARELHRKAIYSGIAV
jgi:hypothetical protein